MISHCRQPYLTDKIQKTRMITRLRHIFSIYLKKLNNFTLKKANKQKFELNSYFEIKNIQIVSNFDPNFQIWKIHHNN